MSTTVGLVWGEIVPPTTAELLGGDGGVGAVSTFEGVTRNLFGQRTVIDLVYEAYEEMAVKVLREIVCERLHCVHERAPASLPAGRARATGRAQAASSDLEVGAICGGKHRGGGGNVEG
ncbi:hypothetical protein BASA81_006127 [Batrachochytrium salamandrivorans]|nr:hypothetical protein BASA81_006127 [Batrachochytrium salamandrivorans]